MTKILVIEDEESFREGLEFMLAREGYEVSVAADGTKGLAAFSEHQPDLVLLDVMLPGMSGTEICKAIRQTSKTPIIMLTAKDAEVDKVVGLEIGADDYVTKPFSTSELLARIKAVLRRGAKDEVGDVVVIGNVSLNTERHVLMVSGQEVQVPLKEFELLEILMRNAGRVLSRTELMNSIWGENYFGDGKTLDVHIKRLRSKIEVDSANPELLKTIRGLGYRFEKA